MKIMEAFCNDVVVAIQSADNEEKVVRIIEESMISFQNELRSYNRSAYVMNMIVSLRATSQELQGQTRINIKTAVAIFREMQKKDLGRIF